MPEYSFESLSDYDFELLARDLLQRDLGVRLESFAKGRDQGIDLRYVGSDGTSIVVQCKHYTRSGFSKLKSSLLAELPKIAAFCPSRYVVVTSLSLTPQRKDDLVTILAPFGCTFRDIYGQEDLNNLLGTYPEIERKHYKLWLTSTTVLERIVTKNIFRESISEIEAIRRRISRYVDNQSFERALGVLDQVGYCIISGIPGIGKSTLAEMLVMHFVELGWEAVRVWENISEARRVFDPSTKQIFLFDDFLGKTGLEQKLDRNEDERLLRFLADVTRSTNTRIILTTREYILSQAKSVYEGLHDSRFDTAKYTITLDDYTRSVRARILYNHLYFSDLPEEYLAQFRRESAYLRIIQHRNFNPRIVEKMTEYLTVRSLLPSQYVDEFIHNLDNPTRVWEFAYRRHLSTAGRDLVLVLASLPNWVMLRDLAVTFGHFYAYRSAKYGYARSPHDFHNALKEVCGTFLTTSPSGGDIVVELSNPSVRDFLEAELRQNGPDLSDVLAGSSVPDQAYRLWELCKDLQSSSSFSCQILDSLKKTSRAPSIRIHRVVYGWETSPLTPETLFELALRVWAKSAPAGMESVVLDLAFDLRCHLHRGARDYKTLGSIVELCGFCPAGAETNGLRDFLVNEFLDLVDLGEADTDVFGILSGWVADYPEILSREQVEAIIKGFEAHVDYTINNMGISSDDYESKLNELEELKGIALNLAVDPTPIEAMSEELGWHEPDYSEDIFPRRSSAGGSVKPEDVKIMFENLRRDKE